MVLFKTLREASDTCFWARMCGVRAQFTPPPTQNFARRSVLHSFAGSLLARDERAVVCGLQSESDSERTIVLIPL